MCRLGEDHVVRIADFGLAKDVYETSYYRQVLIPCLLAHEYLFSQPYITANIPTVTKCNLYKKNGRNSTVEHFLCHCFD